MLSPTVSPTNARTPLNLDLRVGGHGDNWMRLASLYSAAVLRPQFTLSCLVPPMLRPLAQGIFSDRILLPTELPDKGLAYENKGLRALLPRAFRGERFIVPYHRVMTRDWNTGSLKDAVNVRLFSFFDALGWTQLPPWPALDVYQGYLEVVSIAALRDIAWPEYLAQAEKDFPQIVARMGETVPVSPELTFPADIGSAVAVFPSGTSHQFMPLSWARRHLPDAYYCFFHRDPEQEAFRAAGLRILNFFREPGDIVEIARRARWTVTTCSLPSHLLQFSTEKVTVALIQFPRSRIVSPFFRGAVVEPGAPCAPCPHLERKGFPLCKAGYSECMSWGSHVYTSRLLASIPKLQ